MSRLFITLIISFFCGLASAEAFYVVTNKKLDSELTKEDIKKIYLGYKKYWSDGTRIRPLHIEVSSKSFRTFLKEVLDMDSGQYNSYWRRKLFSGRGYPPKKYSSQREAVESLKNSENAIGILPAAPKDTPLKVLDL